MTDHDTMKRIFETTVPDMNGTPRTPSHGLAGGRTASTIAPPAHIVSSLYKQHTSKQYTPSGAHEWDEEEQESYGAFMVVMAAGCAAAVTVAYIVLQWALGAL